MMKLRLLLPTLGFSLLALLPAPAAEKLPVASLSTILSDFARNVGGEHVAVTDIIAPGIDPHVFEPTVADVRRLSDARLILVSGLGFESFLGDLQESVGGNAEFVIIGDSVKPLYIEHDPSHHDHDHSHHHHGEPSADGKMADPHWWHSVANARLAVDALRDGFTKADPANAAAYRANAAAYQKQLADLERELALKIAPIPRDRRVLVTSHDALAYFAADHHFTIHAVQGISTSDQPSSKNVRALIDTIRADSVQAIFAENIENPKILAEITRETGATIGGELYADGLGTDHATTYLDMMRHNVDTIVAALQ